MTRLGTRTLLIGAYGLVIIALFALPQFLETYYLGLATKILIFSLFAISLNLILGYTGLPSLGHAACFGTAAYTTGILAISQGWNFWLSSLAGVALAGLQTALFGILALRSRGSYFLMITMALAQVAWGVAVGWRSLTGGDDGISAIPRPNLGLGLILSTSTSFYYLVLVTCLASILLFVVILQSPFGYSLRGIRESEARMRALGFNVWAHQFLAFVIAGMMGGLAGSLYVYFNRFVSPDYLHVARSAEVLLMVILGGAGTLLGPIVGATVIIVLENVLSNYTERWLVALGTIYVLVALYAPDGLNGYIKHFLEKDKRHG